MDRTLSPVGDAIKFFHAAPLTTPVNLVYDIRVFDLKECKNTMANMTFSLDAPTKKRFVDFCDSVGLSASSVITVYIKTVVRENRIPFTISADPLPNAETIAAMEEGERIAHDPTRPRYTLSEALKELKR